MQIRTILGILMLLVSGQASAAILDIDGEGQLLGASNVEVGGVFYDVAFVDGTCEELFSGCNEASDFAFQETTSADLASFELLIQVLRNYSLRISTGEYVYHSNPSLTNGCEFFASCVLITPNWSGWGFSALFNALPSSARDRIDSHYEIEADFDTSTSASSVYVAWSPTPVPEPPLLLLMFTGVFGLGIMRYLHSIRAA